MRKFQFLIILGIAGLAFSAKAVDLNPAPSACPGPTELGIDSPKCNIIEDVLQDCRNNQFRSYLENGGKVELVEHSYALESVPNVKALDLVHMQGSFQDRQRILSLIEQGNGLGFSLYCGIYEGGVNGRLRFSNPYYVSVSDLKGCNYRLRLGGIDNHIFGATGH